MRSLSITLVALALLCSAVAAEEQAQSWTHVRPLGPIARDLLATSTRRSDVVRDLVDALERTDVVAYLSCSMVGSKANVSAHMRFVSSAAGVRYVLIDIDVWASAPWTVVALFGHELQHALEVAAAPDVHDLATFGALYRRIGWEGDRGHFETEAARAMGRRVRDQLSGFASKRGKPSE